MKYLNKACLITCILLVNISWGQITIDEKDNLIKDEEQKSELVAQNVANQRVKVDGIAAVVGDYLILESDILKAQEDRKNEGFSGEEISKCFILKTIMQSKMFAHHAIQDSLEIQEEMVRSRTEQQLQYMVQQTGGNMQTILDFYDKETEEELRRELFNINLETVRAQEMQGSIVDELEVTPAEVRQFYDDIPTDEKPFFGTQVEVAQIVVKPEVSEEQTQKTVDFLNKIRQEVLDGARFSSRAVLYSDDRGTRTKGGYLEVSKDAPLVKEFKDTAFSLEVGEVSKPFKTIFGWHILTVEKIRGQFVDVRHILKFPEITKEDIEKARQEIDTLRQRLVDGEIEFAEAAKEFSDEEETRESGGQLINDVTLDKRFELSKMDPELYNKIINLKEGEISPVYTEYNRLQQPEFKLLTITKRIEEHNADFNEDYARISELALRQKEIKEVQKWQKLKIKDTYIKISKDYKTCEFTKDWIE